MNDPAERRLLKVIFARCMYCSGDSRKEVRRCRVTDCPLWPYRNGKMPGEPAKEPDQIAGQTDMFDILNHGV